jgi:penicillin amidase
MSNIFLDEMGEDIFNEFVFVANVPYRSIQQILEASECSWFDDVNTNEVETKNMIIRKSLADALSELEKIFGKNINEWQWGKLHQFKFKHPFSGYSKLIDNYIDAGYVGIGGDGTTIFNTEYPFSKSREDVPGFNHEAFENNLGPSMRYIFDFAKPDEFFLILTSGQSGNIMSDHYKDMVEDWLRGNYIRILTDETSIKSSKHKLLRILPSN